MLHAGANGLGYEAQDAGPQQHFTIWGSGPNDIYTGGSNVSILHSTGDGTRTPQTSVALSSTAAILAIWGSGPNDVYAIDLSDVFHSVGDGNWTKVYTPPSRINAIWGSGSDDVYVVGDKGGIYHRGADGRWKSQASGSPSTMFSAVWGS